MQHKPSYESRCDHISQKLMQDSQILPNLSWRELDTIFPWHLLTWCTRPGSNAWSQRSPQRRNWQDCVCRPHPPSPSHCTVTERLHHSQFNKDVNPEERLRCSLTTVMFTTFFTKAAASSSLYIQVPSWFNKKVKIKSHLMCNFTVSFAYYLVLFIL